MHHGSRVSQFCSRVQLGNGRGLEEAVAIHASTLTAFEREKTLLLIHHDACRWPERLDTWQELSVVVNRVCMRNNGG